MGTVNRLCRGLLSLIDAKTQGQNPDGFGSEIVPVLDVSNFLYSAQGSSVEIGAQTFPIASNNAYTVALTVPDDEVWHLRAISGEIENNDAALVIGAVRFGPTVYIGGGGNFMPFITTNASTSIQATSRATVATTISPALALTPGSAFYMLIDNVTPGFAGANPTIRIRAFVNRLKI